MSVIKLALCSSQSLSRKPLPFNKFVNISRTISSSENRPKVNKSEWDPIYKFDYIQSFASANKSKYYQMALTAVAIPASFAAPEVADPLIVAWIGISGVVTLSLASYAFKDTVGFIYTSKQRPEMVKFSYLNFWGSRKDVEMKINDVVPLAELPKSISDPLFTSLQFSGGHPKLKLVYKFGGVTDVDEFSRIFGNY